jgi:hypothetical protein
VNRDADTVQAHYLAALTRRLQGATPAVQRVLQARLAQAQAQASAPVPHEAATARPAAPDHPPSRPRPKRPPATLPPASALARLNQHVASATQVPAGTRAELRSAQAFRDAWSRISAEDEVTEAVQRGPENAGPLNSHMLVLRTLGLLRELSPDYLQRFMAHADTLLWLEQAALRLKPAAASKGKAARARK